MYKIPPRATKGLLSALKFILPSKPPTFACRYKMTNDTNKIKLLVLWDILCKNTDENHAMNSDEIQKELAKCGISVMRKWLQRT